MQKHGSTETHTDTDTDAQTDSDEYSIVAFFKNANIMITIIHLK